MSAAPSSQVAASDAPGRDIRLGAAIFVAFFVILLGWAAFARLDAGAYATPASRQTQPHDRPVFPFSRRRN